MYYRLPARDEGFPLHFPISIDTSRIHAVSPESNILAPSNGTLAPNVSELIPSDSSSQAIAEMREMTLRSRPHTTSRRRLRLRRPRLTPVLYKRQDRGDRIRFASPVCRNVTPARECTIAHNCVDLRGRVLLRSASCGRSRPPALATCAGAWNAIRPSLRRCIGLALGRIGGRSHLQFVGSTVFVLLGNEALSSGAFGVTL